jgi:uncharacterized protein DUF421
MAWEGTASTITTAAADLSQVYEALRYGCLIRNGKVDLKALAASHMSEDDLAEDLRQEGIETRKQAKTARLERSGKLSVIRK